MQPNQTLILSRYKECFGLKIPPKDWNFLVKIISKNSQLLKRINRYSEYNTQLVLNKFNDEFLFGIKDFYWQFGDLSEVKEEDKDY